MAQLNQGATPLASVWDSFARTDLIDPGSGQPYELYMDGAAGSVMPPAEGHPALWRDIGLFPFATEQPARVFIIGPGAGLDVWFARQGNATTIDAVEVNRASVDLTRAYAAYNSDLYDQPGVRIEIDEGRSVLARAAEDYDLIFLAHVVTLAAERGGLSLVENSAFTLEAFTTYLDHLTPSGALAIKLYDEPTLTRALATAVAVLGSRGLTDAEALTHVISLLDTRVDPPIPLLLVRNTAYTSEDALSIGAVAREVGFTPLFLPGVVAQPPLDAVAAGTQSLDAVITAAESNLAPVSDDRPFFYHFDFGLPLSLKRLLWLLLALIGLGGLAVGFFIWRSDVPGPTRWSPLYFRGLGRRFYGRGDCVAAANSPLHWSPCGDGGRSAGRPPDWRRTGQPVAGTEGQRLTQRASVWHHRTGRGLDRALAPAARGGAGLGVARADRPGGCRRAAAGALHGRALPDRIALGGGERRTPGGAGLGSQWRDGRGRCCRRTCPCNALWLSQRHGGGRLALWCGFVDCAVD